MKKVGLLLIGVSLMLLIGVSCTSNQRAKAWGGTMKHEISPDQEFVNITWKGEELWILTKKRTKIEKETYYFNEKSSFGMVEGTVILIEK